jgi:hypothetical protein
MKNRRKRVLFASMALSAALLTGFAVWMPKPPTAYDKIQIGMPASEVEDLLGKPANHWLGFAELGGKWVEGEWKHWQSGSNRAYVVTLEGVVIYKEPYQSPSLITRLTRWLAGLKKQIAGWC